MDPFDWNPFSEIEEKCSLCWQYIGNHEDCRHGHERHSSMDNLRDCEEEAINYAIALSLQDEYLKEDSSHGVSLQENAHLKEDKNCKEVQLVEDECYAMALQESLLLEQEYSLSSQPSSSGNRYCAGCKSWTNREQLLSAMGAFWHPNCFQCHGCALPITDSKFSVSTSKNQPYHKSCYKKLLHPRCYVCNNFLPLSTEGIEFKSHHFWMMKYCPSHEQDGTPRCSSCDRMEPGDMQYMELDNVRKICLECFNYAIMDSHECEPLYHEIQKFFEGLNMKLDQKIPVCLVKRQALNQAVENEKNGHHHLPEIETRGICVSEEISGKPRIWLGDPVVDNTYEVSAILILRGLPRLLTGSILAHEMMHAWLRLRGYSNLSPKVEEGICQVLAHMWLDWELNSGDSDASSSSITSKGMMSDSERQLGKFFMYQIESDETTFYGEGFRLGNKAVSKYGLKSTLDHIQMTRSFPL